MQRSALLVLLFLSIGLNIYLLLPLTSNSTQPAAQSPDLITQAPIIPFNGDTTARQNNSFEQNTLGNPVKTNKTSGSTGINTVQAIQQAIVEGRYSDASRATTELSYAGNNTHQLAQVSVFWFKHTQQLISQKHFIDAEYSIGSFLDYSSADRDFLHLHVKLLLAQKLLFDAIDKAYSMQYSLNTLAEQNHSIKQARELVQQQSQPLLETRQWPALAELASYVLQLDPQYAYVSWLHALAQYEQGELNNALNTITPLLAQPDINTKANELHKKIQAALLKPSRIPLGKQGEHYIVQGMVNQQYQVELLLDTGASISLLSQATFENLTNYTSFLYIQDISLSTAGGLITAPVYQVNEFALDGYVVKNLVFAVSPYMNDKNDGLLGMNYLKHFDFYLDQDNQVLSLSQK